MANDSDFGLGSSIFTRNKQRGWYIAQNLKVGMANINDFGVNYMVQDLPFGGIRLSGYGRFGGPEGLRECCAMKSTTRNTYSWLTTSLVLPPLLDYPVQSSSSKFAEGLARFYYGLDVQENLNGLRKMLSCLLGLE
jgi:delta 1-pyrroline-5-carboxylate dehydrogenase